MQDSEARRVEEAARYLSGVTSSKPSIGVVLGSGLGAFADRLSAAERTAYADIPHMPSSSVEGHSGQLHFGRLGSAEIACLSGRVHLYEGYPPARVVFGVRLLAAIGCTTVLLTNAAGGIAPGLCAGDLMLIEDHLNLTGLSPLVGPARGDAPRFPDMSVAYDERLRTLAKAAARDCSVELGGGVYAAMLGPSYETPAEIRMLRTLGADAVGMSTVVEVIALRHLGVRVGALSLITNLAAGISETLLDHSEVQRTAERSRVSFGGVLARWIEHVHDEGSS